jgi:SAM-dependent methyltransferase
MMARRLIDRDWKVFGLDMSPEMLRECRDGLGRSDRSAFLSGRIESLPFKEGAFDAVLGMGVLEYVMNAQAALVELSRVTRPGGVLVVTMLNRMNPWIVCHRLNNWIRFFRHKLAGQQVNRPPRLKLHSERGLRKQMESTGLCVHDAIFYGFNVFPSPLVVHMPRHVIRISKGFDTLFGNRPTYLSSSFIIKAKKE